MRTVVVKINNVSCKICLKSVEKVNGEYVVSPARCQPLC